MLLVELITLSTLPLRLRPVVLTFDPVMLPDTDTNCLLAIV